MLALLAVRHPVTRLHELAAAAWHNWFLDRHAQFWLGELGLRASQQMSARIVEIIDETPDTRSFVLAPDRRWPGHRAGQFVPIEVEIDGVRTQRCYSISSGASASRAKRITITVKRVPGGRMSNWLHDELAPGDIVGLGAPRGDFVVAAPGSLLLVAGGSGITPIVAILRDLEARRALGDVVVVHAAGCDTDAIFGRELATMAHQHPALRLIAHRSTEHGRLDAAALHALVPDAAAREIYVCGPSGLLDLVKTVAGGATVHHERFVTPASPRTTTGATPVTVKLRGRSLELAGAAHLLEELERAGERPPHGCRMGICNSCRCRKRTGSVEDVLTGVVSSVPDQEIRLCVSIARSDLELAL
ncbi:MAG: Flavodoxin reductase (ferredoxin-NADPH reductase) family 1 [Myxococcales bacterium]|nr:Flavodoxin reductase (ferredoxin-NADPH reductase) family 1 [Myxococcales bacterium]